MNNSEEQIIDYQPHNGTDDGSSVWLMSYSDLMTLLATFFVLLLAMSEIKPEAFEEVKKQATESFGGTYKVPYVDLAEKVRAVFANTEVEKSIHVESRPDGILITFSNSVFFEPGAYKISSGAEVILEKFVLRVQEFKGDFHFIVEGHTDNVPIKGVEMTNWELSGLRASQVVRKFLDFGYDASRFTATGYADTQPIVQNSDASGVGLPENQAINRRVVIKLVKDL